MAKPIEPTEAHHQLVERLTATTMAWLEANPDLASDETGDNAACMVAMCGLFVGGLFESVDPNEWSYVAQVLEVNMRKAITRIANEKGIPIGVQPAPH